MTDAIPENDVLGTLRGLVAEVDADVERWALERAYMVAGGPLLVTATRLGWPQADVFLSFTLAVRRLANLNRPPDDVPERRSYDEARAAYDTQHAIVTRWLAPTD